MESNEAQETRLRESNDPVTWNGRANPEAPHECTFHLKNPRQADLEALVLQISDPKSPMYGKHMTKDQIHELTRNVEGEKALEDFLHKIGAKITKRMSSAITASAPIGVWEQAFHTELHRLQSPVIEHELVRAKHYYLPSDVAPYVQLVTDLIDLPVRIHRGRLHHRPHL
jgi:subtilase family serine protease